MRRQRLSDGQEVRKQEVKMKSHKIIWPQSFNTSVVVETTWQWRKDVNLFCHSVLQGYELWKIVWWENASCQHQFWRHSGRFRCQQKNLVCSDQVRSAQSTKNRKGVRFENGWLPGEDWNIQGVFLTGPPLTMSLDWPPPNLLGLAPPNFSKCWNHIHFARHLDTFQS